MFGGVHATIPGKQNVDAENVVGRNSRNLLKNLRGVFFLSSKENGIWSMVNGKTLKSVPYLLLELLSSLIS